MASYIFFVTAYVTRVALSENYFEVVLVLFCLSFLLNVMRVYQLFYISERLGPKVTMILGMVSLTCIRIFSCEEEIYIDI